MINTIKNINILLIISAILILSGCLVGPDFTPPTYYKSKSYLAKQNLNQIQPKQQKFLYNKEISSKWWHAFNNKSVNKLVDIALINNLDLEHASYNIKQAQEALNVQIGDFLYPEINGNFSAARQKFSGGSSSNFVGGDIFNLYNANLSLAYPLDFFGGSRRKLENLRAQINYQQYLKDATEIKLIGSVITTIINIAALNDQINTTKNIISAQQRILSLMHKQFKIGSVSKSDILLQTNQLAITETTLPPLQQSLDQATHALAVLIGRTTDKLPTPKINLHQLRLPRNLPVRLPSSLLKNRPDIKAAFASLHAANASVGVATAKLFPQFSITGDFGRNADVFNLLFNPESSAWKLTGNLIQPIFHGGAQLAARRQAIAMRNAVASEYKKTILEAFKEVADALVAINHDTSSAIAQNKATQASRNSFNIIQNQYKLGSTNYLEVLTAETNYKQMLLEQLTTRAKRLADTVTLFVSLGGSLKKINI